MDFPKLYDVQALVDGKWSVIESAITFDDYRDRSWSITAGYGWTRLAPHNPISDDDLAHLAEIAEDYANVYFRDGLRDFGTMQALADEVTLAASEYSDWSQAMAEPAKAVAIHWLALYLTFGTPEDDGGK